MGNVSFALRAAACFHYAPAGIMPIRAPSISDKGNGRELPAVRPQGSHRAKSGYEVVILRLSHAGKAADQRIASGLYAVKHFLFLNREELRASNFGTSDKKALAVL
jgi:hypothetical protein